MDRDRDRDGDMDGDMYGDMDRDGERDENTDEGGDTERDREISAGYQTPGNNFEFEYLREFVTEFENNFGNARRLLDSLWVNPKRYWEALGNAH